MKLFYPNVRMMAVLFLTNLLWISNAQSQLYIGTATTDITPLLPVALLGQFHIRIAHTIESPLTANVVALESRGNNSETAIFVSCDLTVIPPTLIKLVRNRISEKVSDLDANKIILTATHNHTTPVLGNENLVYPIPPEIMQIDTTLAFVAERISRAIEKAWENRQPGSVTWGLSYAVIRL
jgi:molybdopterin-guanine dinucleotide biosynthesis protein A